MSLVLLDQWSAIELFCRVIAAFEEKDPLVTFKDNGKIKDAISKCKTDDYGRDFLLKVNNKVREDTAKRSGYKYKEINVKRWLYLFALDIENCRHVVLEEEVLFTLELFINYDGIRKTPDHFDWTKKTVQRKFEGTRWYLYYFDEKEITNSTHQKETIRYIGRAAIYFKEFSRVEIESLEADTGEKINYVGTYSTIGNAESHLQCHLNTTLGKHDLSIFLNLASDKPELSVGHYHNFHESDNRIFFGEVLLDKHLADQKGSITPKLFARKDTEQWNKLPEHVKDFFNEERIRIATKTGIKSIRELKTWISERINQYQGNFVDGIETRSNFLHKEEDIKTFRKKFYFYYSTKSNKKEEEDGKGVLFWNHIVFDFTSNHEPGKLKSKAIVWNRKKDNEYPDYDVEMIRTRDKDPVLLLERRSDSNEPVSISIIEPMSVSYNQPIKFGFCFHDDWSEDLRLSPVIISTKQLFGVNAPGPLTDEQAAEARKKWQIGFWENEEFTIFEEFLKGNIS